MFDIERDDEVFASKLSDGIFVLTLNRPKGVNSLSRELIRKLNECLQQLKNNQELRVLIIRSTVKGIFCTGADLKERALMDDKEVSLFVSKLRSTADSIYDFPFPTIAAIDGFAIGGGLEYALAADLRVVASNAKLGLVETKLAVIPGAGGTQRLSRLIPMHLAKELIFTGRLIEGQQSLQMGLANYLVEQNKKGDSAYKKAVHLAEEIVKNGPVALRMAKMAINIGSEVNIEEGLSIEETCYNLTIGTKDRKEGLASFIEKRPPIYLGE